MSKKNKSLLAAFISSWNVIIIGCIVDYGSLVFLGSLFAVVSFYGFMTTE